MGPDPVAHLPGQVQVLEDLEHPDALGGVVPSVGREIGRQRLLAGVAERRVAHVVAQRDGLGQRLVEAQRGGQRARDLGDLEGVGQARDEMVVLGVEEDLGLVLEPAEGLGVDDPIAVTLEGGPKWVGVLGTGSSARIGRPGGRWGETGLFGFPDWTVAPKERRIALRPGHSRSIDPRTAWYCPLRSPEESSPGTVAV